MGQSEDIAAIRIDGLTYIYADGRPALQNLNLWISPGESVGLIGPNGAGKTTLMHCLSGVVAPPTGKIQIAGCDPGSASDRKRLPRHVGIVFQSSDDQLFAPTIRDDVAFGPLNLGLPEDEVRKRVEESLRQVRLTSSEERMPHRLSGGEKRRAALAGILAMRPDVLLLDEPSIFLDPRGRRELMEIVNGLSCTKIIASHDLGFIRRCCSRTLILDEGRIVADEATMHILGDATLLQKHGLMDE